MTALPPGFELLEQPAAQPKGLPPGFELEQPPPADMGGYSPEQVQAQTEMLRAALARTDPLGGFKALGRGGEEGAMFNWSGEAHGARAAAAAVNPLAALVEKVPILRTILAPVNIGMGAGVLASGNEAAKKAYDEAVKEAAANLKESRTAFPYHTGGAEIAGAVVPTVPAGKLIQGGNLLYRGAKAAGIGAGIGSLAGAGEGTTPTERLEKAGKGAAIGAAFGAGAEVGMSTLGGLLGRVFGASTTVAPGVDPAARVAAAAEFGIPLTRGQATGDIAQTAWEQAAAHGARGAPAANIMARLGAAQREATQQGAQDVGVGFGGAPTTARDAGDIVSGGMKTRAAQLRGAADTAYASAAGKDAWIQSNEVAQLGQKVAQSLQTMGIQLDTYGNFAGSQNAMNLMRRVAGFEGAPPGQVVAQSVAGLEQARQGLLQVRAVNGQDARALKAIRNAFDDWMDDAVNRKLFSGDPTAVDDLKTARSFWSQYKGLTAPKEGDAPKLIATIIKEQRTGEEVANWMLGMAGAGQAGRSARAVEMIRNHLGQGPEWEALRQSLWQKLITPPATGAAPLGPQALASNILKFTRGDGAPLARVLFDRRELAQMNRFAQAIRYTVPDPRATNPSKSGYELARFASGAGGTVANLGATAAGLYGAYHSGDPRYLALAALPLLKSTASLTKAIGAGRPIPSTTPSGIRNFGTSSALVGAQESQ